jgi:hypothetical protein
VDVEPGSLKFADRDSGGIVVCRYHSIPVDRVPEGQEALARGRVVIGELDHGREATVDPEGDGARVT